MLRARVFRAGARHDGALYGLTGSGAGVCSPVTRDAGAEYLLVGDPVPSSSFVELVEQTR